jgi:hypothetical protein
MQMNALHAIENSRGGMQVPLRRFCLLNDTGWQYAPFNN